jgi:hypothetical protein
MLVLRDGEGGILGVHAVDAGEELAGCGVAGGVGGEVEGFDYLGGGGLGFDYLGGMGVGEEVGKGEGGGVGEG